MAEAPTRVPRNDGEPFPRNAAAPVRNAKAPWNEFSPDDYCGRNYHKLQAEDQEIIRLVHAFFIHAFENRPRAQRGVDIGSGPNLYPALLMLPWTEQILLTDFSENNVNWLRRALAADDDAWTWQPFWHELQEAEGYRQIGEPRKQLREACAGEQEYTGIKKLSVFKLPKARWEIGTMFFVAESITEDPREFRTAVARFVRALKPRAPFAATFMAGSHGYPVAGTDFPALPITRDDVRRHLTELRVRELSVELLSTEPGVRDGYEGMIVATGFACDR